MFTPLLEKTTYHRNMPASNAKRPVLRQRKTIEQMSVEIIQSKEHIILPKLPVPDLQETLKQYLLVVKPLTSERNFENTKTLVEEFGRRGGVGEQLQKKLIERHAQRENWAGEWWLDDMYLNNRAALPINSNPGMVLPRQKFENEISRLRYAAKLASGMVDFKIIIDNRALPVDVAKGQLSGQPMCMEQYYRLLNSYRIPGYQTDNLVSFRPPTDVPQHIIVACNNQFFAVDVTLGNYRLTEGDFVRQFQRIVEIANKQTAGNVEPVGILTSINRDNWAEARNRLMQDSLNRSSLDSLERCIFVLCLDKSIDEINDVTLAHQMLHGAGPDFNSSNRWYDKTVQLMISENGACGLCYEHSASEGIAVIALIEHLLNYIKLQEKKALYRSSSTTELPSPKQLMWKIDLEITELIRNSVRKAKSTADTLDMKILRFKDYGKEFIKRQRMSPDAYIQVALQVTYYSLYKHLVSTYESASTRRFRKGRVDNIRAATVQALVFAESIAELDEDGNVRKDAKRMQLLQKAIKSQTGFTMSAITGHGIDCHLLGLKMVAEEMNLQIPKIFSDPSYALANYFQLSTSQIPTKTDSFMCYGPVVPDGYGVSYNPQAESIVFCISSFSTCSSTNSHRFASALTETLRVMNAICQEWNQKRSSSSERIETPSQFSLHRRVRVRTPSIENEALRKEINEAVDERSENEKPKATAGSPRRKFYRHKSFCVVRPDQAGPRDAYRVVQTPMPQNTKLSRCYSEFIASSYNESSVQKSSSQFGISNDLMEVLAQESVEFI